MSSHFTPVGLPVEQAEDIDRVLARVLAQHPSPQPVQHSRTLLAWRDLSGGGVDVLMHDGAAGAAVECVTPQYLGDSRQRVRLGAWQHDDACAGCTLGLVEVLDESGEMVVPLAVAVSEVARVAAALEPGSTCDACLVIVAEHVDVFADGAAFLAVQEESEGPGFTAESLLPYGIGLDEDAAATPHVLLNGTVLASRQRESEVFGLPFWHLLVRTYGGTFDVMVAADRMSRVDSGATVSVRGWVCGRVGGLS